MAGWEQLEFDCRQIEKDNRRELEAFVSHLADAEGLKSATVDKHAGILGFFCEVYLSRKGNRLSDIDEDMIVDFMGSYFIRKVLNSSKSDVPPYLAAFKKYAKYLYGQGRISGERYGGIVRVCKAKDFFYERFDRYLAASGDGEFKDWLWSNDFDRYESEREQRLEKAEEVKPFDVNDALLRRWQEKQLGIPPVARWFQAFLQAVCESGKVKTTLTLSRLPRKFWQEFDERSGLGLMDKPSLNQEHVPLFQFFHKAALYLDLVIMDKQFAYPTRRLDAFLQLSGEEQAVLLLDALWNGIKWRDLQPSNFGGRPEVTQSNRWKIAEILKAFPPDQPVRADDIPYKQLVYGALFNSMTDVFLLSIAWILETFGLLEVKCEENGYKGFRINAKYADQIMLTRSGLGVFGFLAGQRNAETPGRTEFTDMFSYLMTGQRQPALQAVKTGRNAPCPCGSGKKYKHCCL
jgi:hypothetical protein